MLKLFLCWLAWTAFAFVMMAREPRDPHARVSFWTNIFCWSALIGVIVLGFSFIDLIEGGGANSDDRQYPR